MKCRSILILVLLAVFASCGIEDQPHEPSATPSGPSLLILGDSTANEIVQAVSRHSFRVSTSPEDWPNCDFVLIVQDGLDGVMPIHSQILESFRDKTQCNYVWVITNTAKIDDQELLELEELEARELLNSFGLPGDTIQFAFDSSDAPVERLYHCPKGMDEIIRYLGGCK